MAHPVVSTLQHTQFWKNSFHVWHKWFQVWGGSFAMTLALTYILKGIQLWLCNKTAITWHVSCRLHSSARAVLNGFVPYLAQMITSVRGCVSRYDFWPRSISSGSFSHDFVVHPLKIWPILSCPLYGTYSSEWTLSIFGTNDHWYDRVFRI